MNSYKFTLSSLIFCASFGFGVSQAEGLGFDKTRLIIQNGAVDGSFLIDNDSNNAFLVRTHIEDSEKVKTSQAKALPPIFQLNPRKAARIRVVVDKTKVATDRETMFWMFSKAYPAQSVDDKNQPRLQFNYINRIKVFYRPQGLEGTLSQATKDLKWSVKGDRLFVQNDSPFNISFASFSINGKLLDTSQVLAPFSSWHSDIDLKKYPKKIQFGWNTINEFGGVTTNEMEIYR